MKKKWGENCIKMWPKIFFKCLCVQKLLLKKVQKLKHKKQTNKKHESVLNLWGILGTELFFFHFGDHIFKTVVPTKKNSKLKDV